MGLLDLLKKQLAPSKTTVTVSSSCAPFEKQVVPIEARIKRMDPIAEGLYAHEILGLSYAETFTPSQQEFQQFWWWQYGVKDVRGMLDSLQERGFITVGGAESAVRASKAADLKEFLKAQGLKVSGKKEELIERVLSEADRSAMESHFREETYVLTPKGKSVLGANMAVVAAHKDPSARVWDIPEGDLNRAPKSNDERWGDMNAAYMNHVAAGDFGQARNVRFEMAKLLESEGRYPEALANLCGVMAHDLSGAGNGYNIQLFIQSVAPTLFTYEGSPATIPPGIIKLAKKYQKASGFDDEELKSRMLVDFQRFGNGVPIKLFTPEESVSIFEMECAGDKAGLAKLYDKAGRRFFETYVKSKR